MKLTVTRKYHLTNSEVKEAFGRYLKSKNVPYPDDSSELKFSWNAASTGSEAFIEYLDSGED